MGTHRQVRTKQTKSIESVLAMFVATTNVSSFGTAVWPHHRAFYELWQARAACLGLEQLVGGWEFHVTSESGYALRDVPEVVWNLAAEGWLTRKSSPGAYVPTDELREHGCALLAEFDVAEARVIAEVAQRWKTWASIASKSS